MSDIAIRPAMSLHTFLVQAITDPGIDVLKLEALLKMQRQALEDEDRREFSQALSAAQSEMPRVKKNGTIRLIKGGVDKGTIKFAALEDIDDVLRPIYSKYGFSMTYSTEPRPGSTGVIFTGTLLRGSASRSASIPLPQDCGFGRNDLQAYGSTMSYGIRYVLTMLFNLVREGDDDDGQRGGTKFITPEQVEELALLCEQVGRQPEEILDRMFGGTVRSLREIESQETFLVVRNLLEGMRVKKSRESGPGP